MACLDTSALLDLAGRRQGRYYAPATAAVASLALSGDALVTTRFNVAELYVGIERSSNPEREAAVVGQLLEELPILDFDEHAARLFAKVTAHLLTLGKPVGDMDVLIASVALASNQSILTRNTRHFRHIPGLQLVSYGD